MLSGSIGMTRKCKVRENISDLGKNGRRRSSSPQSPPISLFSCLRFLHFADPTISEPWTG